MADSSAATMEMSRAVLAESVHLAEHAALLDGSLRDTVAILLGNIF
jgi:hypothetical protein